MEGAREAVRALGDTGLVAIRACGHWWSYLVPMRTRQMYDFARLNFRVPCPFCSAGGREHATVHARAAWGRVN